jgi:hypothetical protein
MNVKHGWNWVFINGGATSNVNNYWFNFDTAQPTLPVFKRPIPPANWTNAQLGSLYNESYMATMSDVNGNLIFFTDGYQVFDANGNELTDVATGKYLIGGLQGPANITAVPDPHNANEYYIFTTGNFPYNGSWDDTNISPVGQTDKFNQLCYTKVKFALGNYYISNTDLNVPIGTVSGAGSGPVNTGRGYAGALTTIPHQNGVDFWLVALPGGTDNANNPLKWETYLVDNSGVNPGTLTLTSSFIYDGYERYGTIKVNTQHDKIAFTIGENTISPNSPIQTPIVVLYDFNKTTGVVSNEKILMWSNVTYKFDDLSMISGSPKLDVFSNTISYITGCEFDPNNNYLYISVMGRGGVSNPYANGNYGVLQIGLSGINFLWPSAVPTPASTVTIPNTIGSIISYIPVIGPGFDSPIIGGPQVATDNKIYYNINGVKRRTSPSVEYGVEQISTPQNLYAQPSFIKNLLDLTYVNSFLPVINQLTAFKPVYQLPNISKTVLPVVETYDNIKLTPCCDTYDTVVVNGTQFPPSSIGQVVCVTGIHPISKCYTATQTNDPINFTGPFTFTSIYQSCNRCFALGCQPEGCPPYYYNLLDCCTGEPVKNNLGNPIQFVYNGVVPMGNPIPGDFTPPIAITSIAGTISPIYTDGCATLNQIEYVDGDTYLNWGTDVGVITSVAKCSDCSYCGPCYKLTDCRTGAITYTITDLSQYLGQTVVLLGDSGTCYFVELGEGCTGSEIEVDILKEFASCSDCNPCYKLVDCDNPANFIYSDQDSLGAYVNPTKIVKVNNGSTCYIVQKSEVCTGPFTYVTVNDELESCAECKGCFKLTNCEDETDVEYVIDPQLTQYLNQAVVLQFGTKCYKVSYDNNCTGVEVTLQIGQTFQDNANQTACEQCIPAPKPPKLTNERPVRPGYIKPKCPNQCETGCSACNNDC